MPLDNAMTEIDRPEESEDLWKRRRAAIKRLQSEAGLNGDPFDMKAFLDAEWEAPKGDFSKTDLGWGARTERDDS